MMFMGELEIEEATERHASHPTLGPATTTLYSLMRWTNRNSDGWAYWQKPIRAAEKLQALIQDHERWYRSEYRRPREGAEATLDALKTALRPVKAFRTRQGADFTIFESMADIEAAQQRRAEAVEASERAELVRLQAKYQEVQP